ncbi:MAG: FadR/GntR family transcriptional regulator [Desulfuromonadaceae bacterium]|nr:FadR/GntR family transcriptional regulator [Desulfuromonadaceae bacterium]
MTETSGFTKLNRSKRAYEEVANQIRAEIRKGNLKLSDQLPTERELSEQLGVSRVVVREAIRTLELSGFLRVKTGSGGGVFVAQDYDRPIIDLVTNLVASGEVNMEDLFTVRILVESYAIDHLAGNASPETLKPFLDLLDETEAAKSEGENIRSYNIRFHRLLVRTCGNFLLMVMGEIALALTSERISSVASKELSSSHYSFHKEILKSIKAGDAASAKQIVVGDIKTLLKVLAEKKVPVKTS